MQKTPTFEITATATSTIMNFGQKRRLRSKIADNKTLTLPFSGSLAGKIIDESFRMRQRLLFA